MVFPVHFVSITSDVETDKTGMFWVTGCLNGGGQIKPKPGQSAKDLIQHLESVYMENVRNLWLFELFLNALHVSLQCGKVQNTPLSTLKFCSS